MKKFAMIAAAALSLPNAAHAVTVLTFEGVGNAAPVGNFYAPEYVFGSSAFGLIDTDAGGGGNFANEPSANTIMGFLNSSNAILDVTNGFTTGFSFFYSSAEIGSVTVFDGPNGTGNILASLPLAAQFDGNNCVGDPFGNFCNWTPVGVTFSGTAFSISFAGGANASAFDDITFGSSTAGGRGVPEPTTWAMMLAGFGLMGFAMRRQRKQAARVKFAF